MKSEFFSKRAIGTFNRMGNILLPNNNEFPSFEEFGGIEHVDELVRFAPEGDIKDLNMLMTILSFMPTFVLTWLIGKMAKGLQMGNGPIASLFRMLNLGIRGLIFSCYYTENPGSNYKGQRPIDIVGYEINRSSN